MKENTTRGQLSKNFMIQGTEIRTKMVHLQQIANLSGRVGMVSAIDYFFMWFASSGQSNATVNEWLKISGKTPQTLTANASKFRYGNNTQINYSGAKAEFNTNNTIKDLYDFVNSNQMAVQFKNNPNELLNRKNNFKMIYNYMVYNKQISKGVMSKKDISCVELLKNNKQLILTGAPGTGKTYFARHEIADGLGIVNKDIQMEMVQFHPSCDYTDFMDGIRPDLSGANLSYTLKNGSFKEFCRKAGVYERIRAAGKTIDKDSIKEFLGLDDENELLVYWQNDELINDYEENNKLPPFLFIIDEINRAEISKVLGEIMFCLDPDYRGKEGKIKTQYSSLATADTFFISVKDDMFFIPSNVYIVGTMNDIDRSVEIFDFALRRRFAWYEVKANDVMDEVLKNMQVDSKLSSNEYDDYLSRIELLNESLETELRLSRHYHLGPSYFGKIVNYYTNGNYKEALKQVWKNHILQIITEYVKGKHSLETKVEEIGQKFCE